MQQELSMRALRATVAATVLGSATLAQALTIQFNDTTPGGMAANQLAAFNAAASIWTSRLADPVTVFVTISFRNDGNNGILGSTGSSYDELTYSAVRAALVSDRKSALDTIATNNLQAGAALRFQATNLDLTTRLDNDTAATTAANCPGGIAGCSFNNTHLALTTANAKALGFAETTNSASPDGTIAFNGFYAGQFDFTRSDGISSGQYDFVSIAAHEIGHALGFVSGVDDVDYCSPISAGRCAAFGITGAYDFEQFSVYSTLDLFRYSAAGVLDMRVGGRPYFSVDGGATAIEGFSNGSFNGSDGYQASHFRPGPINLLNPYGFTGLAVDPTAADLAAFDAIGWDLAAAVPEPAAWLLLLGGVAALRWRSRMAAA